MKRTLRGRESGRRPTGGCRRPVRARCRIRWRRCCRRGSDARRRRAGRQPAPSGCAACRAPGRRAAGSCRRPCRSCLCPRRRDGGCSGCPDLPSHAAAARPEASVPVRNIPAGSISGRRRRCRRGSRCRCVRRGRASRPVRRRASSRPPAPPRTAGLCDLPSVRTKPPGALPSARR